MMVKRIHLSILSSACVIVAWYLITSVFQLVPPHFLPSPLLVIDDFLRISRVPFAGHTLAGHVLISFKLVLWAFLMAVVAGVSLGIVMGWYPVIDRLVNPIFQIVRPIPPLAWIPLAIVWFGIGTASKVFVIWLSAFVPSLINTYIGMKMVDPVLINAARVYGARDRALLYDVAIPSSIPLILTGIRLSLNNAWMTIVAAELVAATGGLGYIMQIARRTLEPSVIILGMLSIGVLGTVMTRLVMILERKICPWRV